MIGKKDPEHSVVELQKRGPQMVMLTVGVQGPIISVNGKMQLIPAYTVKNVVDTTGAGDAFTSGVIAGMLEGLDWEESARMECTTAAIKIAHLGLGVDSRIKSKLKY